MFSLFSLCLVYVDDDNDDDQEDDHYDGQDEDWDDDDDQEDEDDDDTDHILLRLHCLHAQLCHRLLEGERLRMIMKLFWSWFEINDDDEGENDDIHLVQ